MARELDPPGTILWSWTNSRSPCDAPPFLGMVCDPASGKVVGLSLPEMGLSGQLPGEMAQMSDVTSIEVPRNYLQGDIPNTINNLGKLQVADLAGNGISGQIPDLSPMRALRVLLLDGNQLQDAVPYTITALSNLEQLGLSSNTLAGALPSSLSALTRLTWLRVDGNQLVGPLPPGLAAMASAPGAVFNLTANDPTLCGKEVRGWVGGAWKGGGGEWEREGERGEKGNEGKRERNERGRE
ncbi:unnamed protein product, partial [Closterium sp. NIES-64]